MLDSPHPPLFTVVIPVYNAANSLERAVRSVTTQGFHQIEIILVNDGSMDDSHRICHSLAATDPRIRAFDQTNHGVSVARNVGLDSARGLYIVFLDADDYMEPNALFRLSELVTSCPALDLVTCAHRALRTDGTEIISGVPACHSQTHASLDRSVYLEAIKEAGIVPWGAPKNVIRTELVRRASLRFVPGLLRSEDALFYSDVVEASQRFGFFPDVLFNYQLGVPQSAMSQQSPAHLRSRLMVRIELFHRAERYYSSGGRDYTAQIAAFFARDVRDLYQVRDARERTELTELILGHPYILSRVRDHRLRGYLALTKVFGLYGGSVIRHRLRQLAVEILRRTGLSAR